MSSSSTEVTPEQQKQNVEKVEAGAASNDAVQPEDTSAEKQKVLAPIPSVNVWQVRKTSSPSDEEAPLNTPEKVEQSQEGKLNLRSGFLTHLFVGPSLFSRPCVT
jgi:hypothetical protein